jgi:DNA-binding CsgD family transcriptional regulator
MARTNRHNTARFEDLLEVRTIDEWKTTVELMTSSLGFSSFLYGFRHTDGQGEAYTVLSSYPVRWRAEYDAQGFALIDPTVQHCARSVVPVVWMPQLFRSERQQDLLSQAAEYKLRSGASIPIHGINGECAMMSLASDKAKFLADPKRVSALLPNVQLLAAYVHESYAKVAARVAAADSPRLTPRELECLKWIAGGKTAWETSQILSCSERTINFHVTNIVHKLGVSNRRHAVARALSLRLIQL